MILNLGGLIMNLENKEKQKKSFSYYLDIALQKSNMNMSELAKKIGVTRQHMALLKKENASPSSKLLTKIYEALEERKLEDADIIPVIMTGLDLQSKNLEAIFESLPYSIHHESGKVLESRCILTDKLAECLYDDFLDETIKMVQKDIVYYYFLPKGSSDWQNMLIKAGVIDPNNEKLLKEKTYCIKSPSFFICSRMRIDNITYPDPEVYLSLGPITAPTLQSLSLDVACNIINIVSTIVEKAKKARKQNESTIVYQAKDMTLKFELEGDTII